MAKKFSLIIQAFRISLLAVLCVFSMQNLAFASAASLDQEPEFLSPEKAFVLSVQANENSAETRTETRAETSGIGAKNSAEASTENSAEVSAENSTRTATLQFQIAPGYQLYQDHLKFQSLDGQIIEHKNLELPVAIQKQDEVLGETKIYRKNLTINVPLSKGADAKMGIKVQYQGCAEAGFCYPPISKMVVVHQGNVSVTDLSPEEFSVAEKNVEKNSEKNSAQPGANIGKQASDRATTVDAKGVSASANIGAGTGAGGTGNRKIETPTESEVDRIAGLFHNQTLPLTLLAFLGIGLLLAFTPCVLPMVPILANILVGQNHPLSRKRSLTLSALYILSMASCYALAGVAAGLVGSHLSTTLQQPLVLISLSFLLLMFSLSQLNLIQVQVPVFISQALNKIESKNQSQGSALGAISMGAISALVASPCVTPALVGALTYISQTGNALLGGMALFSLAFGMGLPLLIAASIGSHLLPKAGSWMVYIKYVTGALLLVLAGSILLRAVPLQDSVSEPSKANYELANSTFTNVSSSSELSAALSKARAENKPIILDVYANWCVSCRQIDKEVFENKTVLNKLSDVQLLRLDLSRQTKESEALQKELGIVGPPMMIFFWPDGKEAKSYRLAGKPKSSHFLDLVTQFLQETKQQY